MNKIMADRERPAFAHMVDYLIRYGTQVVVTENKVEGILRGHRCENDGNTLVLTGLGAKMTFFDDGGLKFG